MLGTANEKAAILYARCVAKTCLLFQVEVNNEINLRLQMGLVEGVAVAFLPRVTKAGPAQGCVN